MNRIITLSLVLFLTVQLQAQKLVSYEQVEIWPVALVNGFISGLDGTYNVSNYSVTYNTIDTEGNEHLASGLICVPQSTDHLVFPLACFQHGTVSGRQDVPSQRAGGHLLGVAFSTHGYVVAMPDYVGLGISPGVHPYIHSATEASAGIDLLFAAREMIAELDGVSMNDQVFVSGYSQGGHAAMALQRSIEQDYSDDFNLVASAPMSGPYSVSGKMSEFTLGDEEYMTVGYLAWLTMGYQRAYPDLLEGIELSDVFKPEYLDDIEDFKNENITLFDEGANEGLNTKMQNTLISTVGAIIPKNTLQPEILDALLNDPTHPMSMALADNDNYDWTPQVPTNLYYCKGDDQVTYENAILAEEVMTANGSTTVTAVRKDSDSLPLNHTACVVPASLDALEFFDSFSDIQTGVTDFENHPGITLYGYGQTVTIDVNASELKGLEMALYDLSGRLLSVHSLKSGRNEVQVSQLPAGGMLVAAVRNAKGLLNVTRVSLN